MANTSERYREAEAALPPELRNLFSMLVEMYKYSAAIASGWSICYYKVMAEMTRQMAGNESLLSCLNELKGTEYQLPPA